MIQKKTAIEKNNVLGWSKIFYTITKTERRQSSDIRIVISRTWYRTWTRTHTVVWLGRSIWLKWVAKIIVSVLNFNVRAGGDTRDCVLYLGGQETRNVPSVVRSSIGKEKFIMTYQHDIQLYKKYPHSLYFLHACLDIK